MNYQPKTYLKQVHYIAPAAWERYLTTGNDKRMSAAQKAECDKFLRLIARDKGAIHFVISGQKCQNTKIRHKGCRPSQGMYYTVLVARNGRDVHSVLKSCEDFIGGFEGDESQEGIDGLLASVRNALAN